MLLHHSLAVFTRPMNSLGCHAFSMRQSNLRKQVSDASDAVVRQLHPANTLAAISVDAARLTTGNRSRRIDVDTCAEFPIVHRCMGGKFA